MVDSRAHSFVHVLPGESRRYAGEVLGDVHQQRKRVGGLYVCVQRGMYGSKAMAREGGQALSGRSGRCLPAAQAGQRPVSEHAKGHVWECGRGILWMPRVGREAVADVHQQHSVLGACMHVKENVQK